MNCRISCSIAVLAFAVVARALLDPGLAAAQSAGDPAAALPVAGNYCVSCHTTGDARLDRALEWRGSVATTSPGPCPGLRLIGEQNYYVDRQLLANSRLAGVPSASPALDDSYARLLDFRVASADAFEAEAQSVSYAGARTYGVLGKGVESRKRTVVLLAAALLTVFLWFAFGWGLRNTLKAQPARLSAIWRPGPRTALALAAILALFALPLFRSPPAAVATSTPDQQAAQAELDLSTRAGASAERAIARAAALGEIASIWVEIDRGRAEEILAEALAAESAARADADALWGRAQAAQEAAVGSRATQDKAALVADELLAVRNRAWGLRLMAEHWSAVDAATAGTLLERAEAVARANPTVYGQLDLRAIASVWAVLDPARVTGLPAGGESTVLVGTDAAEIDALRLYRSGAFPQAWESAARIADEWSRARAQAAIAAAWGNAGAAGQITVPPLRDRALRLVAVGSRDPALAAAIASPYERVTALAASGRPSEAAAQSTALTEKLPLVAVIEALAQSEPAAALPLVDQLIRESDKAEALRALAAATGDQALFDRALAMAAAARVRGDSLAPVRASLALARAFVDRPGAEANVRAALAQAYELASQMSVRYK